MSKLCDWIGLHVFKTAQNFSFFPPSSFCSGDSYTTTHYVALFIF
nr:MAG TPA: hypothetical protein [Caudoviricetes sp.]